MKPLWVALTAAILLLTGASAEPLAEEQANPLRAIVLPAHVFQGASENGGKITTAVNVNLVKNRFEVLPAADVTRLLRELKIDLSRPQPVAGLRSLLGASGADYLVYPRVLGVGMAIGAREVQATILVNVLSRNANAFVHTRQIGQVFLPNPPDDPQPVISRADADLAAARLLAGFYTRRR
jgi:hypothetical protein